MRRETIMSKEKFELVFLAGGALLDTMSYRLKRRPVTAEEAVGAAMHTLCETFDEQHEHVASVGIDVDAADNHLKLIRAALCADVPRRLLIAEYLAELAELLRPVDELAADVEELRAAVTTWLS